jgi:YD repeat-containing protein
MRSASPLALLVFVAATLHAQKFTILEVPNGIGTMPLAISPSGEIVGVYQDDQTHLNRAFIRNQDRKFTTFNDPNAFTPTPTVVNSSGVIAGYEFASSFPSPEQFFVRSPKGKITEFNLSPLFPFNDPDIRMTGINARGEMVGFYSDTILTYVSFLRAPDGTITTVDLVGEGAYPGTFITAINDAGVCTGSYTPDQSFNGTGFIRKPDGDITSFTVLNALGTYPEAINARGQVAGNWDDSTSIHGFVRDRDGKITTIDAPGAQSTSVVGIDARGQVAGNFYDPAGKSHGFVREVDGTFTTIDAPDATDTFVVAINPRGEVIGNAAISIGASEGFLWSH